MRVLVVGDASVARALERLLVNESGVDGQYYVVERLDRYPPENSPDLAAPSYEIALVQSRDRTGDEQVIDALLPLVPVVILLVAVPDTAACVAALRRGAWDYVEMAPRAGDAIQAVMDSMSEGVKTLGVGRAGTDVEWIREHFQQLHASHADQWIAVRNAEVIAADVLFARLHRREETEGATFWKIPRA